MQQMSMSDNVIQWNMNATASQFNSNEDQSMMAVTATDSPLDDDANWSLEDDDDLAQEAADFEGIDRVSFWDSVPPSEEPSKQLQQPATKDVAAAVSSEEEASKASPSSSEMEM